MKKVWLDTDIGTDIDDAVALAYLLSNPNCELVGVSTVSAPSYDRARIASAICTAAGKDIPIYAGVEDPLFTPPNKGQIGASQVIQLPNWPHRADIERGCAIERMYEAIANNPGEVTLLAIGPMTNVALLIKTHPDVAKLVKSVVLMCGEFFRRLPAWGEAEWNSVCDPYASAFVYGAENLPLRTVGLDVTMQVTMAQQEVEQRFTSPALKVVYDFAKPWFERAERIVFHDPLAAVSIFQPDVMGYARGAVSVELKSDRALGRTYFTLDEQGRHEVGKTVDADRFFEEYFRYA